VAFSIRARPDVASELRAVAAAERRSVNKQIELMLEEWLRQRRERGEAPRDGRPPG
jgi:hypothetical protein